MKLKNKERKKIVIIISDCITGGTIRREIIPLLGKHTKLCYNPFFMDGYNNERFLKPEIVLFGVDDNKRKSKKSFIVLYIINHSMRLPLKMELIKVVYNTLLGRNSICQYYNGNVSPLTKYKCR